MAFKNKKKVVFLVVLLAGLGLFNTFAVYAENLLSVNPVLNGDFENGKDGAWSETADMIVEAGAAGMDTHSGSWLAWMGGTNGTGETYVTTLSQTITIPPEQTFLSFWYMVESVDSCNYDYLNVYVDNVEVYSITLCTNTELWEYKEVDLSNWVNQTVELKFSVSLDTSLDSNLFLDDVALSAELSRVFLPLLVRQEAVVIVPTSTPTASPTVSPGSPRNGFYTIAYNYPLSSGQFTVLDGKVTNFGVSIEPNASPACDFAKFTGLQIPINHNSFSFNTDGGDFTGSGTFSSQTAASGLVHVYKSYIIVPICSLSSYSATLNWTATWTHY